MRNLLLSSLALVATLSLVGCGSDDDGNTTTTETDTGSSTEETSTTDTGSTPMDTAMADDTATGDTGGGDDTGAMDTGAMDTGGDTPTAATWTQVYAIFSAGGKCTGCHGSAGNLNLSSKATAYSQLKLKAASGQPCESTMQFRVKPGDATNSLLVDKLSKASSMVCGDRMPRGETPLPAGDIDKVRSWINAGALDN